jgi:hypothetical protein
MANSTAQPEFNPAAAVMAWLWPGLGHISLGHKRRGLLIMFGVLFLFLGGVLIGGIDSVDRREDHLWFLAQMLCGPIAFGVDFLNQNFIKSIPEPQRFATIGLNKPNEMGTLFTALAGLMNLVVILDAMFFTPKPLPETTMPERRKNTGYSGSPSRESESGNTPAARLGEPGYQKPGYRQP